MIKNIPKESDQDRVFDFLINKGLPHICTENIKFKENGKVMIDNLDNSLCLQLVKNIHHSKFLDNNLLCFGVVPVTPRKLALNTQHIPQGGLSSSEGASPLNSDQLILSVTGQGQAEIPVCEVTSEGSPDATLVSDLGDGSLMPPPQVSEVGGQGLERRKSVKDLVTDFSSCLSSPEEESLGDFEATVTKRKKKKRKASSSPLLEKNDK